MCKLSPIGREQVKEALARRYLDAQSARRDAIKLRFKEIVQERGYEPDSFELMQSIGKLFECDRIQNGRTRDRGQDDRAARENLEQVKRNILKRRRENSSSFFDEILYEIEKNNEFRLKKFSSSTWNRFVKGDKINKDAFYAFCKVLGVDIEQVLDVIPKNNQSSLIELKSIPIVEPFGERGKITDSDRFFNRSRLLSKLVSGIKTGCNQSLVGQSRIGKSSILYKLKHMLVEKQFKNIQIRILDLQFIRNEQQFYDALCDSLQLSISGEISGYNLTRAISRNAQRFILCLDEVEVLTDRSSFSKNLLYVLRGLADGTNSPLTLVVTSRESLHHLFPERQGHPSPFDSIFRKHQVLAFDRQESEQFIRDRLQRYGRGIKFSSEQIQELVARSEGHPAVLQGLAQELYEGLVFHT